MPGPHRTTIKYGETTMPTVKSLMLPSFAVASALLLAACNTTSQTAQTNMTSDWSTVTGKEWQLIKVVNGEETLTPMSPVLAGANFAENGKVAGSTGCNRFFGTYEQSADKLKLSPLGATQMMCMEDAMAIETAFKDAMEKVTNWQLANDALVLNDASGKAIMEFAPIAP